MATTKEQRIVEIIINGQQANASLKEMNAAAAVMWNQLQKMGKDDPGRAQLKKDFQQLKENIKDTKDEMLGLEKNSLMAKLGLNGVTSATGLLKAGFQAAVAAFLPLLALDGLIELAKGFLGLVDHVDEVRGSISSLTGEQGAALDGLYVQVEAISKTFDKDWNEVMRAGNVVAKEFGISNEQAFELIEKGILAGADANGDFLEQLSEYSTQFATAGASAEDFVAVLAKGANEGIFSDKAADTVKEFGLRIREQTKATGEALDAAFGQAFTDKIFKGINDGSMTTVEALKLVSTEMNNTTIPASALQTVVADVFGGPGEDAGIEFLKSLKDLGGEIDSMIDKNNILTSAQIDQLDAEKQLAAAQAALGATFSGTGSTIDWLMTVTKAWLLNAVAWAINDMKGLRNAVVGVWDAIKSLGSSFGAMWDAFKNGDFSGIKKAFSDMGTNASKAYREGYNHYDKIAAEDKLKLEKQEHEKSAKQAEELRKDQAEKTRKEKEKEADKAAKEAERKLKEQRAKEKQAREQFEKEEEKAALELAKLKIDVMADGLDKTLAKLRLANELELKEMEKHRDKVVKSAVTTQAEKDAAIARFEEQKTAKAQELANQEAAARKKDEDLQKSKNQKSKDEQLKELDEKAVIAAESIENEYLQKQAALDGQVVRTIEAEQIRDMALLEQKNATAAAKLAALEAAGQGESAQALKLKNEVLRHDSERTAKMRDNEEKLTKVKSDLARMQIGKAQEAIQTGIDLLGKDTAARKVAVTAHKAFSLGKIAVDLREEIQAIWKHANQNPMNALIPGSGNIIAGVQTALAIGRAVKSTKEVTAQQFYAGGMTKKDGNPALIKMMERNGIWEMASGQSGGSIGAFAEGGMVNEARLGLIGEKGAELVIPNWMIKSPKYANTVAYLEAERQKGVTAFATGGPTSETSLPAPRPVEENQGYTPYEQAMLSRLDSLTDEIKAWPTKLQVYNDVGQTQEKLELLNEIREMSRG
ncbi:phage tail tape measure protein [Adhaeribacter swui]|uniref:Phage tail tape measure protein n=1 Tax=Adhaeribacter swui TaxID=2086471 RepID=A0A7G7GB38_9BACT|nr:phage tail tape measure protein [Adhaeribacter swui]QNF34372.1 phage tail tape measure protein [Adhaeribacter swui]